MYLWTCGGINGGTTASCYAPADEEECDDGNNVSAMAVTTSVSSNTAAMA